MTTTKRMSSTTNKNIHITSRGLRNKSQQKKIRPNKIRISLLLSTTTRSLVILSVIMFSYNLISTISLARKLSKIVKEEEEEDMRQQLPVMMMKNYVPILMMKNHVTEEYRDHSYHRHKRNKQSCSTNGSTTPLIWHHTEDPCDSPQSLQEFFETKNEMDDLFWRERPVCKDGAYNHIHVVAPFYNLPQETIQNAVQSVMKQNYPRITLWLYDDGSPDGGRSLQNVCGCAEDTQQNSSVVYKEFEPLGVGLKSNNEQVPTNTTIQERANRKHISTYVETHLSSLRNYTFAKRLHCIYSKKHFGPGGGKYWAFRLVNGAVEPNDVVMVLDGDDELLGDNALSTINQKYLDIGAWVTYGSYRGKWSEQILPLPKDIREGKRLFRPRTEKWVYGHPRTFKRHLLDHITLQDFTFADGSWLMKGTDRGFVYRMLELADYNRVGYIPTPIYDYKYSNTSSTFATVPTKTRTAHVQHSIHTMTPSSRLEIPIHVVLLCWKRLDLLPHQLRWLQDQENIPNNRNIHVHLVNNNLSENEKVEDILKEFLSWQDSQIFLSNQTAPIQIHLRHEDPDADAPPLHNFARFVYVQKLRQTIPIEQVIFLDDDQYWNPRFLSTLLKSYRHKAMTTWYGKFFDKNDGVTVKAKAAAVIGPNGTADSSSSGEATTSISSDRILADYWKSKIPYCYLTKGESWDKMNHFKYGGTGGSIFDVNLWLADSQLLRLADPDDLHKWAKIDDLWASYVMDALLGWEIRRLPPKMFPADIGYTGNYTYRQDVMVAEKHWSVYHNLTKQQQHVHDVGTFFDKTVDKASMFQDLQTTYHWDAFSIVQS